MNRKLKLMALCVLASGMLAACGGGGGGGGGSEEPRTPSNEVPDEALLSSKAFTEWAKRLQLDDSVEALTMGRLDVAPSSETDEPESLD